VTSGAIMILDDPAEAAASFLTDYDASCAVVFEAFAGGDADRIKQARDCYRELVAHLAAALGQPSMTPTRGQGLPGALSIIDPRWSEASAWHTEKSAMLVATISGLDGGALAVSISRSGV